MNMPFGAVMTYDYNVENRLTAIHDKEHLLMAALYDGNGDRIFTVTNKEDTSGWHDDGNNGQWSTLKPGGDYDDGTWHPDTSSADDGKWKPDVSSTTSSNDGQWKPDVSSSSSSSSHDGKWRPEPGGNGEWNNDGQWRPDSNNNGKWKPDTTSSLTSSNSNAKVGEDMESSRQTTSSYNDGQWRPDSNNNGQWNPSGNDGQWKPDATSSSTSSSNNGQWNPDSGNNGQWKPDVSSSTSSATNTSSETTSSNVSSETSSDTTSSEVAKDENSGIPDVELAKGDWSNFAYDREMIRDTVLIPNGLNTWNEERYEMTGYINNINTANTQVLMEFHDKGYAGNIYEYGVKRESVSHWQNTNYYSYDGRGSVSDLVDGTGKVQMYHSYEPDGQTTLRFRGYIKNPYRYNAERVDYVPGIADFQYLRARYYAPNLGRFIQQDIVWGTITTPLSQNLFIYVQNNAVNMIDPSGHRAMAIGEGGSSKSDGKIYGKCEGCSYNAYNNPTADNKHACRSKTSMTIKRATEKTARTFCDFNDFPQYSSYNESIMLIVFDGINSPASNNGFKPALDMIAQMLAMKNPNALVYGNVYYDYGVNILYDAFEVLNKATIEAYDPDTSSHVDEIYRMLNQYQGMNQKMPDKIYFVGYSGGGTAAARTAEGLLDRYGIAIDSMVRVGTPIIDIDKRIADKTTDLYLSGDIVASLPLGGKINGVDTYLLDNYLVKPKDDNGIAIHTAYWSDKKIFVNTNGKTNLWNTSYQVATHLEKQRR